MLAFIGLLFTVALVAGEQGELAPRNRFINNLLFSLSSKYCDPLYFCTGSEL